VDEDRQMGIGVAKAFQLRLIASLLALVLGMSACGHAPPPANGYKSAVMPGISRARCVALLGKPQQAVPFELQGIHAEVLTYPFGQVLLQDGTVVAVSVNSDAQFRGPFGVKLAMSEDDLHAALAAYPRQRSGHQESYDAIEKSSDTRTKDIYDDTDHIMIELTATNANDPLAPFNVAQITYANNAGMQLIDSFTKARVNGQYSDVHVDNFTSDSWPRRR
jgi:hypothetical protein